MGLPAFSARTGQRRPPPSPGAIEETPIGRITDSLSAEHQRLHALLDRADSEPFDGEAYAEFRAGLLRHMGIEEKILFREVTRRLGGSCG